MPVHFSHKETHRCSCPRTFHLLGEYREHATNNNWPIQILATMRVQFLAATCNIIIEYELINHIPLDTGGWKLQVLELLEILGGLFT